MMQNFTHMWGKLDPNMGQNLKQTWDKIGSIHVMKLHTNMGENLIQPWGKT